MHITELTSADLNQTSHSEFIARELNLFKFMPYGEGVVGNFDNGDPIVISTYDTTDIEGVKAMVIKYEILGDKRVFEMEYIEDIQEGIAMILKSRA